MTPPYPRTCPECGASLHVREVAGTEGAMRVYLDAYRTPAREGLTWIVLADLTADIGEACGVGYREHGGPDGTCPARMEEE